MMKIVEIREVKFADWAVLYREYACAFKVALTEETLNIVWEWLEGYETELRGIGAINADGKLVAIVHYRRFLRPLVGEVGMFLDDIYVSPSARRQGVGKQLLDTLERIADAQDCTVIRWITSDENKEAHKFYDQFGQKTGWITYDHMLGEDKLDVERK
jgi:ribosomal protein S18 acetylase RimI-like enzyme